MGEWTLCHQCTLLECPKCGRLWFKDPHHHVTCVFCRLELQAPAWSRDRTAAA